jgi:hypothetical protein
MKRTLIGLWAALAVGLAGCAEYHARLAAKQAAEDDAKCQSYGGRPGDPAYIQCRAALDAARTQADATESAAATTATAARPNCPLTDIFVKC